MRGCEGVRGTRPSTILCQLGWGLVSSRLSISHRSSGKSSGRGEVRESLLLAIGPVMCCVGFTVWVIARSPKVIVSSLSFLRAKKRDTFEERRRFAICAVMLVGEGVN